MNTTEKLQILEQIGMTSLKNRIQTDIETKLLIEKYTNMKFKPTTPDEIRKQLCSFPWNTKEHNIYKDVIYYGDKSGVFSCFTIASLLLVSVLGLCTKNPHQLWWLTSSVFFAYKSISYAQLETKVRLDFRKHGGFFSDTLDDHDKLRYPDLAKMKLSKWTDNLPLGALYAVKEAADRGLSNFEIYYPVKDKIRLRQDPVIVGYVKGNRTMFEIFAWDDGKVYDGVIEEK